jgi:photosystem II stability/assembly factor-like uncharacterized protein
MARARLALFGPFCCLMLGAPTIAGTTGPSSWISLGPDGIDAIVAIAVDPSSSSTLYAGTKGAGIYKSTDGAATWFSSSSGLPAFTVLTLAVDPGVPATVYAGTEMGLFRSLDAGAAWNPAPGLPATVFNELVFDPVSPLTAYAISTDAGVFKSTNGGTSWSPINAGLAGAQPRALAVDPTLPSTLFLGTIQAGFFRSTNGGASWVNLNDGLENLHIAALAVDPVTTSNLYAGTTNGGVFKSFNGGGHWQAANSGLPTVIGVQSIRGFAIDPRTPASVFAATDAGVYHSDDGAATWHFAFGSFVNALAMDPGQPDTLYAGIGNPPVAVGGLYRSTQNGAAGTWKSAGAGIRNRAIPSLAASAISAAVYAGLYGGILKTEDRGRTWQRVLGSGAMICLAVDPAEPSTVYSGTLGFGVFKTTNGGGDWFRAYDGMTSLLVFTVLVDPTATATLYAGTATGVFKTTDGAGSWKPASKGLPSESVFALAIDPSAPKNVYVGTVSGFFKSTDAGASWSSSGSGLPAGTVFAVAVDPTSPQTLYAGTSGGPYRSTNRGVSWSPANSGLSASVLTFAFDSSKTVLFAGSSNAGIFMSFNGGASWAPVNDGLTNLSINVLAVDFSGALYAATDGAGVFRLEAASPDREPVEGSRGRPPTRPVPPRP